jgi:hypothetical protein
MFPGDGGSTDCCFPHKLNHLISSGAFDFKAASVISSFCPSCIKKHSKVAGMERHSSGFDIDR